nr:putative retrotransposon Ty1-copia subclass protein [Tanacetum cinerariifolium]
MCLYIDDGEYKLGDLNEPGNYKAALLDPESDKWLDAMNVEMQSMKDNKVWDLVDLPPDGKTVGSKWLFKKKTDMDGAVHTYKAHLVAKGFTQTYRVDYEETFSPVTDIRAIRILIAIAASKKIGKVGRGSIAMGFMIIRETNKGIQKQMEATSKATASNNRRSYVGDIGRHEIQIRRRYVSHTYPDRGHPSYQGTCKTVQDLPVVNLKVRDHAAAVLTGLIKGEDGELNATIGPSIAYIHGRVLALAACMLLVPYATRSPLLQKQLQSFVGPMLILGAFRKIHLQKISLR